MQTAAAVVLVVTLVILIFDPAWPGRAKNSVPGSGPTAAVPIYVVDRPLSTFEEIYAIRRSALLNVPEHLRVDYQPFKRIFEGAGSENVPWEPVERAFLYGDSRPYKPGPPAVGLLLANPFLLVDFNFPGISINNAKEFAWNFSKISDEQVNHQFPYRPLPQDLQFSPAERRARVVYDISGYLQATAALTEKQPPPEKILAYPVFFNAADFGYRAVSFAAESTNLSGLTPASRQSLVSSVVATQGPCSPEGCNTILGTGFIFTIDKVPATAVLHLWKGTPGEEQKPDFVYIAEFR